MARLPYLNANDLAPEDRRLLDPPLNLFRVLAYCPSGARAFGRLGLWIRLKTRLDPRLRQMAILRVGAVTRTEYEYSHHVELGRQFGLSDDDIRAVVAGPEADSLTEVERLVLAAADEMTNGLGIRGKTFRALRSHLDKGMMVELTMTLSYYNGVVRMLNSLDIDLEPDYQRYLEEFPLP